jgi:hypothetical protein
LSSRKEQKEALRREREQREREAREAERRKRLVGYGTAGALVAAAVVALAVVLLVSGGGDDEAAASVFPDGGEVPKQRITDLPRAARAAGCELKSNRVRVGATVEERHTGDLSERIPYQTNPPDGGKHYVQPADEGVYGQAPPDSALVHSLEHGRVVVWVKPSLSREARADLKALFDKNQGFQLLMVPRARMPFAVAATAWNRDPDPTGTGRLLGCPRVTDRTFDALQSFIDEHRGNGPEPVP